MKNLKLNVIAVVCMSLLGIFFTSCEKEEIEKSKIEIVDSNENSPKILMLRAAWWEHGVRREGCSPRGIFCRDWWDCLTDCDIDKVELATDQVLGTGILDVSNGEEVLNFEFTRNNLTKESLDQLLNKRVMELEGFEFDRELVEELYKKAGVEYHGEPLKIKAGLYDVNVLENGDGTAPDVKAIKIKVGIRFKDGKVSIGISISW